MALTFFFSFYVAPQTSCHLLQIAQRSTRARELVNAGYMTISFVDEDCNEARYNYTNRRDSLTAAGSQILKTNFPTPPTFFPSNFTVCTKICCILHGMHQTCLHFSSTLGAHCSPYALLLYVCFPVFGLQMLDLSDANAVHVPCTTIFAIRCLCMLPASECLVSS